MVEYHEPLKLGKGSAFVKSKLRYLPRTDDVWEVDFQPIPEQVCNRMNQGEPWLGLVVSVPERFHLANLLLEVPPPTVNDLARLLAHAMSRPLVEHLAEGCRLDLDVEAVVKAQAFRGVDLDRFVRDRTPRTHGSMSRGMATR